MASLSAQNYLIVADAPGYDFNQIATLRDGRVVVALDGAADHMRASSIRPDIILGDFDTIADLDYWESDPSVTIVPAPDQNATDLQKAVSYCDDYGATTIEIVNGVGGRIDHTLGNIRFMRGMYRPDRPLYLLTELEVIEFVKDSHRILQANPGTQCAIMACPKAVIRTSGLVYDTDGYELDLGLSESVCNQMAKREASIEVDGEALIILSSPKTRPLQR